MVKGTEILPVLTGAHCGCVHHILLTDLHLKITLAAAPVEDDVTETLDWISPQGMLHIGQHRATSS